MRRVSSLAARLPADCLAILEVHLAPARTIPDLSIMVKRRPQMESVQEVLAAPHFQSFAARWAHRDDRRIVSLWLELDLYPRPRGVPVPSLCVKLRKDADHRWVLGTLLPALAGGPLGAARREIVRRCLAEIPPAGQLLYVFHLLPRGGDLRMEIYGLSPEEMVDYLARVAAPVPPAGVARAAALVAGAERTHLSFDVGPEAIRPRIGIEGSFAALPRRERRWAELLGRLESRGLCSPAQRDALLAWPGTDSFWTAPRSWPREVRWMDAFCIRYLSHLKVVWQSGRALRSKAYLAFGPHRRAAVAGPSEEKAASSRQRAAARST